MRSVGSRASGVLLLAILIIGGGCASSSELALQREVIGDQIRTIDSLRAANRMVYAELVVLRDSLQFIDDIETGQYYRDMRSLEDSIRQLEFALYRQRAGQTVAELPADALFEPASATLTAPGSALLDSVASLVDGRFSSHMIRIEGHADNAPLGPTLIERYGSNWGLSAARAASVARYLIEEREVEPGRIEAAAYGSTRPVSLENTAAARRQNRRVRVAAIPVGGPESTAASEAE